MKSLATKLKEVNACQSAWSNSRRQITTPIWTYNQRGEAERNAVAYADQKLNEADTARAFMAEAPSFVRIMVARGLVSYPNNAKGVKR